MLRRTHQPTMVLSTHKAVAVTLPSSPVSIRLLSTPVKVAAFAPDRSQPRFLYSSHSEAEPHDCGDELTPHAGGFSKACMQMFVTGRVRRLWHLTCLPCCSSTAAPGLQLARLLASDVMQVHFGRHRTNIWRILLLIIPPARLL